MQLGFEPSDDFDVTFSLSSTESESDGNPQDLETFDMLPNLNFQGSRADWVSDFLEAAGQPRIDPNNDPRIVLDDFTMPDWCFLDDANPDWDAACEQINESDYRAVRRQRRLGAERSLDVDVDDRPVGLRKLTASPIGSCSAPRLGTMTSSPKSLPRAAAQHRVRSVRRRDRPSYFEEDVYGSPGTGGPNYDRRGTSSFPTGGEWQRCRRRQRAERTVHDRLVGRSPEFGVDWGLRERRPGTSPTVSISRPVYVTRSTKRRSRRRALPPTTSCRSADCRDTVSPPTIGTTPTGG